MTGQAKGTAAEQKKQPATPRQLTFLGAGHIWRKHFTFVPPRLSVAEAERLGVATDEASRTAWLKGKYFRPKSRKDNNWGGQGRPVQMYVEGLRTQPPPAGWRVPEFNDDLWMPDFGVDFVGMKAGYPQGYRSPARLPPITAEGFAHVRGTDSFVPEIGLICLRGRFHVRKPAGVSGLNMTISCRGGFVAYLNGKEFARAHLPKGAIDPMMPADDYPIEAFFSPDGRLPLSQWVVPKLEYRDRWLLRERKTGPIAIDTRLLRKGINVLAIELHRSDYPAKCNEVGTCFATVGLGELHLIAEAAPGAVAMQNPDRLKVRQAETWRTLYPGMTAETVRTRRPIRIAACRNGKFSGQAVVSSMSPITGLRARATSLERVEGRGSISSRAVSIRFGVPSPLYKADVFEWRSGLMAPRLDMLLDDPPQRIEPVTFDYRDRRLSMRDQYQGNIELGEPGDAGKWSQVIRKELGISQNTCPEAVVSVWMSVNIPSNARPGEYRGSLKVEASGYSVETVPIRVFVSDWSLPPLKDYRPLFFTCQSPDSLAEHYGVERWSREHWRLIEKSLELIGRGGNIGLVLPLCAESSYGNTESLVRWIRKGNGWEHDFSLLDRYLELTLKYHQPERLKAIVADVWGLEVTKARQEPGLDPLGTQVTVLDPVTGKRSNMHLPAYGTEACEEMWRPLLLGLHQRLAEFGVPGSLMFGSSDDRAPSPEHASMFNNILPGTAWYHVSHGQGRNIHIDAKDRSKSVPIGCQAVIYGGKIPLPEKKRLYGWRYSPERMVLEFNRHNHANLILLPFPKPWRFRIWLESALIGGRAGGGSVGADYFRTEVAATGDGIIFNRYPSSSVGNRGLNLNTSDFLAPGPEGPVSTIRFENAIAGMIESEARAFLESAILNENNPLPEELLKRCQSLLDERTNAIRVIKVNDLMYGTMRAETPFGSQDHFLRNRRLFDLAAEVQVWLMRHQ